MRKEASAAPSAGNIQGGLHVPTYLGRPRKRKKLSKADLRTLYVHRPVHNPQALINWAKDQGFSTTIPADDLHVTIAFSRKPIVWSGADARLETLTIPSGSARQVAQFNGGAIVLRFVSPDLLQRWSQFINQGASWDWPQYHPHITITFDGDGVDLANVVPYEGEIILGEEVFEVVNEDWKESVVEKRLMDKLTANYRPSTDDQRCGRCSMYTINNCKLVEGLIDPDATCDYFERRQSSRELRDTPKVRGRAEDPVYKNSDEDMQKVGARHSRTDNEMIQSMHDNAVKLGAKCPEHEEPDEDDVEKNVRIVKVDENLGMVFGYAIICKRNGEPYYDLNVDPTGAKVPEHIPEQTMLKASMDFMQNSRAGNEMHNGPDTGTYVYAFPMTTDIAKSLGIQTNTTGLLVGFKPPPEVFEKFKNGTYKGFSIEGKRLAVQEID